MFNRFSEMTVEAKWLLAEGNLVVAHKHYIMTDEGRGNDFAQPSATAMDIFLLNEGVIVEHWDMGMLSIPETSVNGKSMFDGAELYNYRQCNLQFPLQ